MCSIVLLVSLAGCSGEEDGDDDSPSSTPIAEASPVPTPIHDYLHVFSVELSDSASGVDLDDDGSVDNRIGDTLDLAHSIALESIEATLKSGDLPFGDECEPGSPTLCGDTIFLDAQAVLDRELSSEALAAAVYSPVAAGQVNYVLEFSGDGAAVDLNWYAGQPSGESWTLEASLGAQSTSSFIPDGHTTFGPGSVTLTLYLAALDAYGNETTRPISMVLHAGKTVTDTYSPARMTNIASGGAVLTEDVLSWVNYALLDIRAHVEGLEELDTEAILAEVDETLEAQGAPDYDINLDGVNDSHTIGLLLGADAADVDVSAAQDELVELP